MAVVLTVLAVPAPASAGEERLRAAIELLRVRKETPTGYDRDKFDHWIDADGDCEDTRAEVLIDETLAATTGECTIVTGEWWSYYDRRRWLRANQVDVDHLVALAEAWRSGAKRWTAGTRKRFANDLGDDRTLVAVTDNVNASKSDQDPADWLPEFGQCRYVASWVAIKLRWRLRVDRAEKRALVERAAGCADVVLRWRRARVVKVS